MTTHERELTDPVDLCRPDGARLNPDAQGWSRHPLHRANLLGEHGRNKKWDYWAVLAGDLVVSAVFSNVDTISLADVFWVHLPTGETGGHGIAMREGSGLALPDEPGTAPLVADRDGLDLAIADDEEGTHLRASWSERDGRPGRLDVRVGRPPGHESLNVVIPWDDATFNFTSKHQARPAVGELQVGDRSWAIGADGDAWGVLDVGRGRWPSEVTWNWGGGAGRVGVGGAEHVVGIQIGARWTEGTGFTENGLIVDGRLSKIGRELTWDYEWDRPLEPWRVQDPGGQLDLVLAPRWDKHTRTKGRRRGSEVHQVFGTWSGRIRTDDGLELDIAGIQGFAEEARQRW